MVNKKAFLSLDVPQEAIANYDFKRLCKCAHNLLGSSKIDNIQKDFHVSLSRCFSFSDANRNLVVTELDDIAKRYNEVKLIIDVTPSNLFILLNDDQTFKFAACNIVGGKTAILQLISDIDRLMDSINEEQFYKPALPHISLCKVKPEKRPSLVDCYNTSDDSESGQETPTLNTLSFKAKGITLNIGDDKTFFYFNYTKIH